MNLFETVKASVSVPEAAKRYGIHANRHGMARCLFHDDRHPSLKLNQNYYYCFGCGAAGDVIDLVSRVFGLSPYEAARKLAADFGIDPDKPPAAAALAKPKPSEVKVFRDEERYCQGVICDYLHLLEDWKEKYAPAAPGDELDDHFVKACHMLEPIRNMADILTYGNTKKKEIAVKKLMENDTIIGLEDLVHRARQDERRDLSYGEEERLAG